MTTRNEATTTRENEKQTTSRNSSTQHATRTSGESQDRERQLQTGREGSAQTGMTRSDRSRGLARGSQSPFALMGRMMEDMDRMFEQFGFSRGLTPAFGNLGHDIRSGLSGDATGLWSPAVEMLEKGDKLVVRAEIPGVSREDVSVDITDDVLTIEGERRQESEDRGEGFYRSERSYGRFMRSIPLPDGVDGEKADASFQDGVLEITLPAPKHERQRGRKLSIR